MNASSAGAVARFGRAWGLRAVAGLALAASGIVAGELLALLAGPAMVRVTGEGVRTLLGAIGTPAALDSGVLSAPGAFAYRITPACLGLGPAAVVALVVAASSGSAGRRIGLALAGAAMLLAANLVRLVALFRLGSADPEHFDLFHHGLGQAWMLAAMAAFLLRTVREAPARVVPEAPR